MSDEKKDLPPFPKRSIAIVHYYDEANGYAVLKDCVTNKKYSVDKNEFILEKGSSVAKSIYPNRYVEFFILPTKDGGNRATNVTDVGGTPLSDFVLKFNTEEPQPCSSNSNINRNTWPRIIAMVKFFDYNNGYGILDDAVHKKQYYVETDDFVFARNASIRKSIYPQKIVEFDTEPSINGEKAIRVTDVGNNPIVDSTYNTSQSQIYPFMARPDSPALSTKAEDQLYALLKRQNTSDLGTIAEHNYRGVIQRNPLHIDLSQNDSADSDRTSVASDATVRIRNVGKGRAMPRLTSTPTKSQSSSTASADGYINIGDLVEIKMKTSSQSSVTEYSDSDGENDMVDHSRDDLLKD